MALVKLCVFLLKVIFMFLLGIRNILSTLLNGCEVCHTCSLEIVNEYTFCLYAGAREIFRVVKFGSRCELEIFSDACLRKEKK